MKLSLLMVKIKQWHQCLIVPNFLISIFTCTLKLSMCLWKIQEVVPYWFLERAQMAFWK